MLKILTITRLVVSLIPTLIEAISTVEGAFPGKNLGGDKLGMVKGILQGAYEIGKDGQITFDEVWPAVEKTIAVLVSMFNKQGRFVK